MKLGLQSKAELRKTLLFARKRIVKKASKDIDIASKLIETDEFKNASQILLYMALDDEINIDALVDFARIKGKSVAVPYCVNNNGDMEFYYINTLDDLVVGSFGVREPNIDICKKVTDFDKSIIIVPGIAFDTNGYRLGYGKGYYDRFLQNHTLISFGLCYNSLVLNQLPIDDFDKSVDYIITETRLIDAKNGG